MPKIKEKLNSPEKTYKESPLGLALSKALDKVKDYSKYKSSATAEDLYTTDMLSEIEKMVSLLHNSFFPKFDNYNIPHIRKDLLSPKIIIKSLALRLKYKKFLSKEYRIWLNLEKQIPKFIGVLQKKQKILEITEENFDIIKDSFKKELINCTSINIKNKKLDLDPNKKITKIFEGFINNMQYNHFAIFCVNHELNQHFKRSGPTKLNKSPKMLGMFLKEKITDKLEDYHAENFLSPFMIYVFNEQGYKFATSLFYIYNELPDLIKEIAPFFNAEFIYGKTFRALAKRFGKEFVLKKVEGTSDDAYIYDVDFPAFKGKLDANDEYDFYKYILLEKLIPRYIGDYFNDYYENPFVQSEIAKASTFQFLLKQTSKKIDEIKKIPQLTQKQLKKKLKTLDLEDKFNFVSSALSKIKDELHDNDYQFKFLSELKSKLTDPNCTVGEFFGEITSLEVKQRGQEKGYKTDFLDDILPPVVLCAVNDKKPDVAVEVYEIQKKLLPFIEKKLRILDENKKSATKLQHQLIKIQIDLSSQKITTTVFPELEPRSMPKQEQEKSNSMPIESNEITSSNPIVQKSDNINLDISKYLLKLDAYFYVHQQLFERDPLLKKNLATVEKAIRYLIKLLNDYSTSGNFAALDDFVLVCKNDINLFGLNIIPLFNEILAEITSTPSSETLKNNLGQPLLNKINSMHSYGIKLTSSSNIKTRAKGQVAIDLANELEVEVQTFFQDKSKLKKMQFEKFSEHFTKVLHSQDYIMQEHRSRWKVVSANIAIALTGIGAIVLGGYAIHSKITHKHSPVFFNDTKRQKRIKEIEKVLTSNKSKLKPH